MLWKCSTKWMHFNHFWDYRLDISSQDTLSASCLTGNLLAWKSLAASSTDDPQLSHPRETSACLWDKAICACSIIWKHLSIITTVEVHRRLWDSVVVIQGQSIQGPQDDESWWFEFGLEYHSPRQSATILISCYFNGTASNKNSWWRTRAHEPWSGFSSLQSAPTHHHQTCICFLWPWEVGVLSTVMFYHISAVAL